jgi:CheY-like chemotaxis protein
LVAKSVLVVEDDIDIRDCVAEMLGDKSYDVYVATHGQEALDKLPGMPPLDLIIVDLLMPVMDGLEFIRQVRTGAYQPNVPVLVLSASSTVVPPQGIPIVRKPVSVAELLRMIEKTCAAPTAG